MANFSIVPAGGWHFFENDGTKVEGNTFENLVKNLQDYRTANNLQIGNARADIVQQLKARQPAVFGIVPPEDNEAPPKVYGVPVRRRLIDRISNFAANRFSRLGSIYYESVETAQRRAAICASCPSNALTWKSDAVRDCAPCKDRVTSLESLLWKIKRGNEVPLEKKIGACTTFGHDNQAAIWLQEPQLRHRKHFINEAPKECWLRTLEAEPAASAG